MNKYGQSKEMKDRNLEVVRLRKEEGLTMDELAEKFCVSRQRIYQILSTYDATRYKRWDVLCDRLYRYIVEYKVNNDGSTPRVTEMASVPKMRGYSRIHMCLEMLEKQGKIKLVISRGSPLRVIVNGGRWVPPQEFEGQQKETETEMGRFNRLKRIRQRFSAVLLDKAAGYLIFVCIIIAFTIVALTLAILCADWLMSLALH